MAEKATDYLPIYLNLDNQPCLVVGGGAVALGKTNALLDAGASVSICAREWHPALEKLRRRRRVKALSSVFVSSMTQGMFLVIVATANREVNKMVTVSAKDNGCLLNVADDPVSGNFICPSVIDRGPVKIAISSSGHAPALTRAIRLRLEWLLPTRLATIAVVMGEFRALIRNKIQSASQRRLFWRELVQEMDLFSSDLMPIPDAKAIDNSIHRFLTRGSQPQGKIFLVGAGAGDPGLLTMRAITALQESEVILTDRLISSSILAKLSLSARIIDVGKSPGSQKFDQENINQMMIELARKGKRVARLKSGDPCIFGRGGEEWLALANACVNVEMIPGITSASACASYAGIPLTHRDLSHGVSILSGHDCNQIDWKRFALPFHTLLIYMGIANLQFIAHSLIQHGRSETTPVAIISKGTHIDQTVISTTLGLISQSVDKSKICSPSMIIIGEVVTLRRHLCEAVDIPSKHIDIQDKQASLLRLGVA